MIVKDQLYIGGEWVQPSGTGTIDVVSPATEEVIARVPDGTTGDIDRAGAAARQAFDAGPWPRMAPSERADVMAALSGLIQARFQEFATTITEENGSPVSWSVMGQVFSATMALDFYTGLAREYAFVDERTGMMGPALVRKEPVGVVGAIVPWNVPLFVTMLKLGPAMAGGCTVVLKPAPETPLDAYLLADCLQEAGVPPGVVNIVVAGREVGEHLVTHPDVDKIAFTGSTQVGRWIGGVCGSQLKRCSLELGGKSAAIVLEDADLAATVRGLRFASLLNNGEACVAMSRVLAPRSRYDDVAEALGAMADGLRVGDPADAETYIGPMVSARHRERVHSYIELGVAEGATVAAGGPGAPPGLDSAGYVRPTVFRDVSNDMRIAREEVFGPVLCVIPYDDEDDAVRLANDTDYGLAGSVWTSDVGHGLDVARRIRAGTFGINGFAPDIAVPFGGFKSSGLGREYGPEGLSEYVELQSVYGAARR